MEGSEVAAHGSQPELDHLGRLFFTGDGPSVGAYTPERVTLSLAGIDSATDHMVFLHEAHHAGLNDSTAWGVALHLFAALPMPHRACFLPLLNACRLPHEAYATFASMNIAASRHAAVPATLDLYPMYEPLYRAVSRLTVAVAGPHRRYLFATALARLAMQTPILQRLLARPSLEIWPGDLRAIDTPNGRWRWMLCQPAALLAQAAATADDRVAHRHGTGALDADRGIGDSEAVAADVHDAAWEDWERAAYASVAQALRAAGGSPLEFNGHMDFTHALLERARRIDPGLNLHAARLAEPAPDDRALAGSTIQRVRLMLTSEPWAGHLLELASDQFVLLVDEHCRIAGQPSLVISSRLPARMRALYSWSSADEAILREATSPIVAARVIGTDDDDRDLIAHAVLHTPQDLDDVLGQWDARGAIVSIVAASCLIDREWQETWLRALRDAGASIVLVDIELDRFVGRWTSRGVRLSAGMIHVQDTAGGLWALGISAQDDPELWLLVADEITARLFLEQLQRTPDLVLDTTTNHLAAWNAVLPVALTHLLATESFLDLDGLDAGTLTRAARPTDDR